MAFNIVPYAKIFNVNGYEITWTFEPANFVFPLDRVCLAYRAPANEWLAALQLPMDDFFIGKMKSDFDKFFTEVVKVQADAGLASALGAQPNPQPPPAGSTPQSAIDLVSWLWLNTEIVIENGKPALRRSR